MMTKALFALAWCLVLALGGCKDDGTDTGGSTSPLPIDSRLTVRMAEQLSTAGHAFVLNVSTDKTYGCAGYAIVTAQTITSHSLRISFQNILPPSGSCAGVVSPASTTVILGFLASGTYTFTLLANGDSTAAQLAVTDSSYTVSNGEGTWTTFPKTELRKIPSDAIWGDAQYSVASSQDLYNSFLDSLVVIGAAAHVYPEGDYGFFTADTSGAITLPASASHSNFVKTFIYQYTGDILAVRALVKRYGKTIKAGSIEMVIEAFGPRGEAYYSNVLALEP